MFGVCCRTELSREFKEPFLPSLLRPNALFHKLDEDSVCAQAALFGQATHLTGRLRREGNALSHCFGRSSHSTTIHHNGARMVRAPDLARLDAIQAKQWRRHHP